MVQFESARVICQECTVRTPCLLFASDVDAEFGMWGGATPGERQRIKRRAEDAERRRLAARRLLA